MCRLRYNWDKKTSRFVPTKSTIVKACSQIMASTRYKHSESLEDLVKWSQTHVYGLKKDPSSMICVMNYSEEEIILEPIETGFISSASSTDPVTACFNSIAKVWLVDDTATDQPDEFV